MRSPGVLVWVLVLSVVSGVGQDPSQSSFWKGEYEIYQFNFSAQPGREGAVGGEYGARAVDLWQSDYELYQSPRGIAREELKRMNRNRSLEGPMDIRLLDYAQGYGLVWDKGGGKALRGPLAPPAASRPMGSRVILGFTCDGKEYTWTTFQRAKVQLEVWSARDGDFKVPLLQVEYLTHETGALITMVIQFVSKLERVSELPPPLFEAPAGLQVVNSRSLQF
jgi:hypothetical protein